MIQLEITLIEVKNLKQRIISGDLVYKITAGPDGTKILHLLPPPGSRLNFGAVGNNTVAGSRVWYHYYETTSDEEKQRCLNDNKDIIKLPSDVPIDVVSYSELNSPAKQWVREYLTAKAMEVLGRVRGKFGGALGVTDSEVTMDYESLLSEATAIKEKLFERLELAFPGSEVQAYNFSDAVNEPGGLVACFFRKIGVDTSLIDDSIRPENENKAQRRETLRYVGV